MKTRARYTLATVFALLAVLLAFVSFLPAGSEDRVSVSAVKSDWESETFEPLDTDGSPEEPLDSEAGVADEDDATALRSFSDSTRSVRDTADDVARAATPVVAKEEVSTSKGDQVKVAEAPHTSSEPAEKQARQSSIDIAANTTDTVPTNKADAAPNLPRTGHSPDLENQLAEILKPLTSIEIAETDKKNTKAALDLIRKKKFSKAKALLGSIKNKDAKELVTWYGIRSKWEKLTHRELETYRQAHLDWPDSKRLRARAEGRLYLSSASAKEVLKFFKDEPPISGPGKTALARAYLKVGEKEKARETISDAWRHHDLTRTTSNEIVNKFHNLLSEEDHRARVDRFLFRGRKAQIIPAQIAAKFLSKNEQKKVAARVAEIRRARSAAKLIGALSDEDKKDPGIVFARVRWAAKRKKQQQAWDVLLASPEKVESSVPIDGWWRVLRKQVFAAIDAKKYKTAYEIAKRHGPLSVNSHNDAVFVAGWVALRFLKKPQLAKAHFQDFVKSADGPRTRGKSNYWMGRTALALGDKADAKKYFQESAKEFHTYYGQLSLRALNGDSGHLDIPPPPTPSQESIDRFMARASLRTLVVAHLVGRQDLENRFFTHLRYHINEPGELVLLAELAKLLDNTQKSLRIGKRGMFLKLDMAHYAYPTHAMPDFKPLRKGPEKAFLYGIARQESEFNTDIVSHAGARGLMQVMPGTAREVSRRYKVKYRRANLTKDPAYNVSLGSAYLGSGLEDFDGSYIMTAAGYNAGPGRVRQWVKQFGDPRRKSVDPIDWVERIPFYETRNYVMKVLANIQMYRARLGEPNEALRVVRDLYRARSDTPQQLLSVTN